MGQQPYFCSWWPTAHWECGHICLPGSYFFKVKRGRWGWITVMSYQLNIKCCSIPSLFTGSPVLYPTVILQSLRLHSSTSLSTWEPLTEYAKDWTWTLVWQAKPVLWQWVSWESAMPSCKVFFKETLCSIKGAHTCSGKASSPLVCWIQTIKTVSSIFLCKLLGIKSYCV